MSSDSLVQQLYTLAQSSPNQREFHRPIGPHCDIGAVEVGPYVYLPLILR